MTATPATPATPARPDYEESDVRPRDVVRMTILFLAGIAASLALVGGLFELLAGGSAPAAERPRPPARGVPLEVVEGATRGAIEAAARARLHSYAWVDRPGQRVRIPIERALQLLVERGWPDSPDGKDAR